MTSVSHAKHRQIREIGEIRVTQKYSFYSSYYLPSVSGSSANHVFKNQ